MTSYLTFPFTFVFHAALLNCEKPASDTRKNKIPDTIDTIVVESKTCKEFYDNMPNALEGTKVIMIPNDSDYCEP
ncbi:hypothetical protein SAMN05216327_12433 [Dyadobacter sp. SG02]|nr:hypothetical protein SAMN05216327_12433 [Dyadobacter sp. SG02]